ncbi:MAG: EAL domain-containing protein [Burkholderiaceae bacterium]|nr:EAL domain-containing protein [Burkholderiaceae bacterium]
MPGPGGESAPVADDARERTPARLLADIAAAARDAGTRAVVLVVALNRSDRIDALARAPEDRPVLDEIARRMDAVLRPVDRYAFASREEAWVLLPGLASEALAELACHSLIQALSPPVHLASEGTQLRVRASIGGAWAPPGSRPEAKRLVAVASEAAAQSLGREDHVRILRVNDDHASGLRRHEIERDLQDALAGNELEVHFQPQVDLRSGRCASAEALIRWHRADDRAVAPSTIASIAEERGLIVELTRFTMNTALRQMAQWKKLGHDLSVAINLSAVTFGDTALPELVAQTLQIWGVEARRLTLELTESALIRNERSAIELAHQLRELGCRLSIDDFGTGYSSLSYLQRFPLDELKIDRSFVQTIATGRQDHRIVRALVELARAFGLDTVAEGVESAVVESKLRELGCDLAQGFHLSPALPPDDFLEWCTNRNAALRFTDPGSRETR